MSSFIRAEVKSLHDLLVNKKYNIDYYQREYRWGKEQVIQMLDDLTSKFFEEYNENHRRLDVKEYPDYYMGSVIINIEDAERYIVDGQQRLITLTLLMMYIHKRLKELKSKGEIETDIDLKSLILSETYGEKSFNIKEDDFKPFFEYIWNNKISQAEQERTESGRNIIKNYNYIADYFSETESIENSKKIINKCNLLHFVDWLLDKVKFVVIETSKKDDAYFLFETINDRGLRLKPYEMLKGFIISSVDDSKRSNIEKAWKGILNNFYNQNFDDIISNFFRDLFRGKIVQNENEFDEVGGLYHIWFRKNNIIDRIIKSVNSNYVDKYEFFVKDYLTFFQKVYSEIYPIYSDIDSTESKFSKLGFLKYMTKSIPIALVIPTLLAPITIHENDESIEKKLNLVSFYLEIFFLFRKINYSTISSAYVKWIFLGIIKNIRDLSIDDLRKKLKEEASNLLNSGGKYNIKLIDFFKEKFSKDFFNWQGYRNVAKYILARISHFIDFQIGRKSDFSEYMKYEIEHVIPQSAKYEDYKGSFVDEVEFENYKEYIGNLVLLRGNENSSLKDTHPSNKIQSYRDSVLAETLREDFYRNNPNFNKFIKDYGLDFKPFKEYTSYKEFIDKRIEIYDKLLRIIYDTNNFDKI